MIDFQKNRNNNTFIIIGVAMICSSLTPFFVVDNIGNYVFPILSSISGGILIYIGYINIKRTKN